MIAEYKKASFYKNLSKSDLESEIRSIQNSIMTLIENEKRAQGVLNKIEAKEYEDRCSDINLILNDLRKMVDDLSSYELDNGWDSDEISNEALPKEMLKSLKREFGDKSVNKLKKAILDMEEIGASCDEYFNNIYFFQSQDYQDLLCEWRKAHEKIVQMIDELQESYARVR